MSIPSDPTALDWGSRPAACPLRILVADDGPDNQLILKTYLKEFPFDVKFVGDGKDAVEEFQSAPYDLVLMDVQMPEMDGLTATRAVRAIERDQGRDAIPIVALTASTDQADISASFLAGCNAHCPKPISRNALVDVIRLHCPGVSDVLETRSLIAVRPTESLQAMAPKYLARRREELPELERLLKASDWDRLRVLAHNMKGTGGAYGFRDLATIGAAMEGAAKASDGAAIAEQVRRLSDYLSRVELVHSSPTVDHL